MNERRTARARAGTNIALVKYWGKRDAALNLPATGSLSLTLAELGTTTEVRFLESAGAAPGDHLLGDSVSIDGRPAEAAFATRVSRFLDWCGPRAGLRAPAEVSTVNTVPTAAGLASSASGFAALALAASRAAGLELSPAELSALARQGSGSAARSIFGGFVEMAAGTRADGSDAVAHPLPEAADWPLRLVVALTATGPKAIGSTAAMDRTAATSPYYAAWLASVPVRPGRGPHRPRRPRSAPPGRGGRAERPAHARLGHGRRAAHPLLVAGHTGGDAGRAPGPPGVGPAGVFHDGRRTAREDAVPG